MGGAPNGPHVPQWCEAVGPQCPVEDTMNGYKPSLPANTFLAGYFGIALIVQLYLGIRYKTWTYMIALVLNYLSECVGYIGRILLLHILYDDMGFNIQIVLRE
jgi:hypothetical protein